MDLSSFDSLSGGNSKGEFWPEIALVVLITGLFNPATYLLIRPRRKKFEQLACRLKRSHTEYHSPDTTSLPGRISPAQSSSR
jgi:hypothetical protein